MTGMTGMTTWERWAAGEPPRDRDDIARYREYDAAAPRTWVTKIDPGLSRDGGPLQVLRSPARRPERQAAA